MRVIAPKELGLETVAEVSARKGEGWSPKMVQNRIRAGLLPVFVVGTDRQATFFLRTRDVDAFVPPGRGNRAPRKGRRKSAS